jgi:hypothetical protein
MDDAPHQDTDAPAPDEVVYAYKPSLMGAPFEFRLTPTALEWRKGRISAPVPYDQIRRLRLSFRPVSMQSQRFLAEVWPVSGPKLQIASTSIRGLVEQERLDAAYRDFIVELHRRMAAAGAQTAFERGTPPILYWPGLVVFFAAALALTALTVHALFAGTWTGALIVAAFLALLLWHMGPFFRRNRPGSYRPEALPEEVLPRGGTARSTHGAERNAGGAPAQR